MSFNIQGALINLIANNSVVSSIELNTTVNHINTTNITNNQIPNVSFEFVECQMDKMNNNTYRYNQIRFSDTLQPQHLVFKFDNNISVE